MYPLSISFTLMLANTIAAQSLNIPTRSGSVTSLASPSILSRNAHYGNREFDRGRPCNSDEDTGSSNAVFILEDGITLADVIIGGNSLEGVHCKGRCTLRNVWFRDVCEDAITLLGSGDVLIEGGGAQNAVDKVVQMNGEGTVTIRDYTVINAGKLFRSCGDCSNNQKTRNVIVQNVQAKNVPELVGINSNFGDKANVSGSCGSNVKKACQEWKGVNKGQGKSSKLSSTSSCLGQRDALPACPAKRRTGRYMKSAST